MSCVDRIAAYIFKQPPIRRLALYLYIVKEMSPSEIEATTGVTRNAVRGMVQRLYEKCNSRQLALKVAKKILEEMDYGQLLEVGSHAKE